MKQTFDTDSILYKLLKSNADLTSEISGGVYTIQRPFNSEKEDIVVSTIALSQDSFPQIGTSNINIHVKDKTVSIGGSTSSVVDVIRFKAITARVLDAIRSSNISGLIVSVEMQNPPIAEPDINQHYVNIRVNWNIHE